MPIHEIVDRKVKVFGYDEADGLEGDTLDIRAVNVNDPDSVGTRTAPNQGWFLLFYPLDFEGEDEISVKGSNGGEITATVTI